MDEGQHQPPRTTRPRSEDAASPQGDAPRSGGLLSRYGTGATPDEAPDAAPSPKAGVPSSPRPPASAGPGESPESRFPGAARGAQGEPPARRAPPRSSAGREGPGQGGLLSRFARLEAAAGEALENLTGQVLRVANGAVNKSRQPTHTDWRASDYVAAELDALLDSTDWDDASSGTGPSEWQRAQSSMSRRPRANRRAGGRDQTGQGRGDPTEWDQDWDAGWETGTWDTSWAESRSGAGGGRGDDGNWDSTGEDEDDDWSRSLVALGAAGMAEVPMGAIARVRLVLRERPAATTMLIVFLIGFVLTCLAPLLPLLRLGSDAIDLARRGAHIQSLVAGGAQQLIQPTKLALVRGDVDSI